MNFPMIFLLMCVCSKQNGVLNDSEELNLKMLCKTMKEMHFKAEFHFNDVGKQSNTKFIQSEYAKVLRNIVNRVKKWSLGKIPMKNTEFKGMD